MSQRGDYGGERAKWRRLQLLNEKGVPRQSEVRAQLGDALAEVFFASLSHHSREMMGLEPLLKGPEPPLWASPSDVLCGQVKLTPPLTNRHMLATEHQTILELGEQIVQKFFNEILAQVLDIITNVQKYMKWECRNDILTMENRVRIEEQEECRKEKNKLLQEIATELEIQQKNKTICAEAKVAALVQRERQQIQELMDDRILIEVKEKEEEGKLEKQEALEKQRLEFMKILEEEREQAARALDRAMEEEARERERLKRRLESEARADVAIAIARERRDAALGKAHAPTPAARDTRQVKGGAREVQEAVRAAAAAMRAEQAELNLEAAERVLHHVLHEFHRYAAFTQRSGPAQGDALLSLQRIVALEALLCRRADDPRGKWASVSASEEAKGEARDILRAALVAAMAQPEEVAQAALHDALLATLTAPGREGAPAALRDALAKATAAPSELQAKQALCKALAAARKSPEEAAAAAAKVLQQALASQAEAMASAASALQMALEASEAAEAVAVQVMCEALELPPSRVMGEEAAAAGAARSALLETLGKKTPQQVLATAAACVKRLSMWLSTPAEPPSRVLSRPPSERIDLSCRSSTSNEHLLRDTLPGVIVAWGVAGFLSQPRQEGRGFGENPENPSLPGAEDAAALSSDKVPKLDAGVLATKKKKEEEVSLKALEATTPRPRASLNEDLKEDMSFFQKYDTSLFLEDIRRMSSAILESQWSQDFGSDAEAVRGRQEIKDLSMNKERLTMEFQEAAKATAQASASKSEADWEGVEWANPGRLAGKLDTVDDKDSDVEFSGQYEEPDLFGQKKDVGFHRLYPGLRTAANSIEREILTAGIQRESLDLRGAMAPCVSPSERIRSLKTDFCDIAPKMPPPPPPTPVTHSVTVLLPLGRWSSGRRGGTCPRMGRFASAVRMAPQPQDSLQVSEADVKKRGVERVGPSISTVTSSLPQSPPTLTTRQIPTLPSLGQQSSRSRGVTCPYAESVAPAAHRARADKIAEMLLPPLGDTWQSARSIDAGALEIETEGPEDVDLRRLLEELRRQPSLRRVITAGV